MSGRRGEKEADKAAVGSSIRLPTRRRRGFRQLWQLPTFLAGVAAVVALWQVQPYLRPASDRHIDKQLAAARTTLEAADPDVKLALTKAQKVLGEGALTREQEGTAHFLIGSAYVLLGEKARDPADESWRKAREHLEKAAELGVPSDDHFRLTYRLGKAWFHTGGETVRVIDYISRAVEAGVDAPSEAYGILTQAYLRLPKPDIPAAIEANKKRLALSNRGRRSPCLGAAPAGRIASQRETARNRERCWPASRETAPKAIYSRARFLRAQSCQEDRLWSEAAGLWEEIMHDSGEPPCDPGRSCITSAFVGDKWNLPETPLAFGKAR